MNRPTIILHMVTTIDGKITGDFLQVKSTEELCEEYYRIHREYAADAYLCGRVTFEGGFTFEEKPQTEPFCNQPIEAGDFIYGQFDKYAVAVDTHGRLGWKDNMIHDDDPGYDNAHIIEVVTESTPKEYLAYLRHMSISYIICGNDEVDVTLLCSKLYQSFGIKKLMVEGGGITDSLFLQEGLIDEISVVVVPMVDGGEGIPLFDKNNGGKLYFRKVDAQPLPLGGTWLRYSDNRYMSEAENLL